MTRALAFEATIVPYSPLTPAPTGRVSRTVAIREDQTLEQLHEALRLAFGWADPHLYSFWKGGKFWDADADEYAAPFEVEEIGKAKRTARTPIAALGLRKGAKLAYLFDYGDEWRLLLKVVDTRDPGDESYPMLVGAEGTPPPQYLELDEDDE